MKRVIQTSIFLLHGLCGGLYSQIPTTGDCEGAIPIINSTYDQPVYAYPGETDTLEINPAISCLQFAEQQGYWFEFLILDSGILSFNIEPYQINQDYDWALFNLTGNQCADIRNIDSLEVRCNFSALPGITGANGLSGAQNEAVCNVYTGEFYKLYLYTLPPSANGFLLNFGASTCTFNPTLGFDSKELVHQISLSPNPTSGLLTIHLEKSLISEIREIRITDFYGKTMIEETTDFDPTLTFDISDRAAGMYFVQIGTVNKHYTLKLILQ